MNKMLLLRKHRTRRKNLLTDTSTVVHGVAFRAFYGGDLGSGISAEILAPKICNEQNHVNIMHYSFISLHLSKKLERGGAANSLRASIIAFAASYRRDSEVKTHEVALRCHQGASDSMVLVSYGVP